MTADRYHRVWLTWNLVHTPKGPAAAATAAAPAVAPPRPTAELRFRVQMARVERRWSVADVAERVQCDMETLAAFERGDDVLNAALQQRLRSALDL